MKISFGFHFNQSYSPYLRIVLRYSYLPLIKILLKSHFPCIISISGVTLEAVLMSGKAGREFIQTVKSGIRAGIFSVAGCTFAAEIPSALTNSELVDSITRHTSLIQCVLGVVPETFWVSERVLDPDRFSLYQSLGFKRTYIEQQLLPAFLRHRTFTDSSGMICLEDSRLFKQKIDHWLMTGDEMPLKTYLLKKRSGTFCFFEDAEVFRIWGMEKSSRRKLSDFEHLFSLLHFFKKYNPVLPEQICSETKFDIPRKKRQSFWIKSSFENIGPATFFETDKFSDWFDFFRNSPRMIYYKKLGETCHSLISEIKSLSADNQNLLPLSELASDIFYFHRFEFGCPGLYEPGKARFEGIRGVFLIHTLCHLIQNNVSFFSGDLLRNGHVQSVAVKGNYLLVTSDSGSALAFIRLSPYSLLAGNLLYSSFSSDYFHPDQTPDSKKEFPFISVRNHFSLLIPGNIHILCRDTEKDYSGQKLFTLTDSGLKLTLAEPEKCLIINKSQLCFSDLPGKDCNGIIRKVLFPGRGNHEIHFADPDRILQAAFCG